MKFDIMKREYGYLRDLKDTLEEARTILKHHREDAPNCLTWSWEHGDATDFHIKLEKLMEATSKLMTTIENLEMPEEEEEEAEKRWKQKNTMEGA